MSNFYNMDLEVNKKRFPKGMKKLADDIRKLGFRPGLWMAPFGTGNKDFYDQHKSWFLHDKAGTSISCWNGKYTLDPTVKEAREHLKNIFRTASREWGYEFFKIDGMSGRNRGYCAHLYERPGIRERFRVPAHSVRLVVLHPLRKHPQWIGSDRHIAQTAMEISDYQWKKDSNTLKGTIQLVGTFPLMMHTRIPGSYTYKQIVCNQVKCTVTQEPDNILAITFLAQKSTEAPFEIVFT